MEIYEQQEIIVTKEILKTVICDKCKKDIFELDSKYYYSVSAYYDDNIDSWVYLDFCCEKCLFGHIEKYFSEVDSTFSYSIDRKEKVRLKGDK